MGLGDSLLDSTGTVDLVSLLDIDRSGFLGTYLTLVVERYSEVDLSEIGQAAQFIHRFMDTVENLLSPYRFNESILDSIMSSSAGRFVLDKHLDMLREDVSDCIRWYIEDLVDGKEDERMTLGKIEASVQLHLRKLINTLNDEELLIDLAVLLVQIR